MTFFTPDLALEISSPQGLKNQGVSRGENKGINVIDFFDFYGGLVGPEGLEPPTKAL